MSSLVQKKLEKSLLRFKERISNGSFYEAQQTILSITNRYLIAKNYSAAIDLVYNATVILLEHEQFDEAAALYYKLLEIFTEANTPIDEFKRNDMSKISNILTSFPESNLNIASLAKETVKFENSKATEFEFDEVNFILGSKLYYSGKSPEVNTSEKLLITCDNEQAMKMLVDLEFNSFQKLNNVSLFGLYSSRVVLSYILAGNIKLAAAAMTLLLKKFKSFDSSYSFTDVNGLSILEASGESNVDNNKRLINFLQLLITLLQKAGDSGARQFQLLFQNYSKTLSFYEGLVDKINEIGQQYFEVTVSRKQTNMLQSMMGNLLGGSN